MTRLYTEKRKAKGGERDGGGCLAALSLAIAIIIEATVICAAAGGLWPLLVWAFATCVFVQARA